VTAAPPDWYCTEHDRTGCHAAATKNCSGLALQGGGSHGAFTWGVLDRLLDDTTIDIVGVTGTSAGAMNGAVLVDGLVRGGVAQARAELRRYWEAVGATPGFGSFFSTVSGETAAMTPLESFPAYVEWMSRNLSPYDLPASVPPLRALLLELIDFDRLRSQEDIQLVVQRPHREAARLHQSRHLGRCPACVSLPADVFSRRRD
jgi:NTE family protein